MRVADSSRNGFTLVEILVAMSLMAVVVPVVLAGMRVAALAGEVSERKALAIRIASRVLDEAVLTAQWNRAQLTGVENQGAMSFRWTIHNDPWNEIASGMLDNSSPFGINQTVVCPTTIHQITVDVHYSAQNKDFAVHATTLVDVTEQPNPLQQLTIPQQ